MAERETQEIKADLEGRVETGPLRVNDDWAGLFIRGDDALGYATTLRIAEEALAREGVEGLWTQRLQALRKLMESADERNLEHED